MTTRELAEKLVEALKTQVELTHGSINHKFMSEDLAIILKYLPDTAQVAKYLEFELNAVERDIAARRANKSTKSVPFESGKPYA